MGVSFFIRSFNIKFVAFVMVEVGGGGLVFLGVDYILVALGDRVLGDKHGVINYLLIGSRLEFFVFYFIIV